MLYTDPTARVRTGGIISASYAVRRKTHQGCSLSPLLFALAVEPLALAARMGNRYIGLATETGQHWIELYADDMLLLLQDAEGDLRGARELLNEFGNLSELRHFGSTGASPVCSPLHRILSLREIWGFSGENRVALDILG